jgi:hypothetical protein
MGAACRNDPLTEQLVTTLTARPAPSNHWSQTWIDCLLGLAHVSAGRTAEATTELTSSLQMGGQFDHPLTGEAFLALGKLALRQQNYEAAATMFLEATYSAPWFEQFDVMAEAFQLASAAHLASRPQVVYPPLDPAIAWARRMQLPALEGALLIAQAQHAAELNQPAAAAGLITRARRAMARSEMVKGAAGARLSYVAALSAFQTGNLAAGESAWADVLSYQSNANRMGSHRLFEIGLVLGAAVGGQVTPRVANELYAERSRTCRRDCRSHSPTAILFDAADGRSRAGAGLDA